MTQIDMEKQTITGECFCGAVSYVIKGTIESPRSCHCSRCRKAFSAQASAYGLIRKEQFEWITGNDLLIQYVGKQGFGLSFCQICGSTLCGTYNGKIHGITLGCLNGEPKLDAIVHLHLDSRAKWESCPNF